MLEQLYKVFEQDEVIKQLFPKIIASFIDFYGEENREFIKTKLNNVLILPYLAEQKQNYTFNTLKDEISKEVILNFFKKANLEYSKEMEDKIFSSNLSNQNFLKIQGYIDYLKNREDNYFKQKAVKFLNGFNPNVTLDNINELISSNAFLEIDKLIPHYEETLKEYNDKKEKFNFFKEYLDRKEELKRILKDKYYQEYVEMFKFLFSDEEMKEFKNNKYRKSNKMECYLDISLEGKPLIESFSEESENKLKEDINSWSSKSIIYDRIRFFKKMGFDYGDDYQSYLNDSNCQRLVSDKNLIKTLLEKREKLQEKVNSDLISLDEKRRKMQEKVNSQNLFYELNVSNDLYQNGGTMITTNIKKENNSLVSYPVLFLELESNSKFLDKNFIHELNHVLELSIKSFDGNTTISTCGWDLVYDTKDEAYSFDRNREQRQYEDFNEIINELIAQEITRLMHDKGIYIFNNAKNAEEIGGTSYEKTKFLVLDFYNTFKKDIIESRKNGDINILFEKVGKDNFLKLNNLFHNFNDNFPEFTKYQVIEDIKNNKETNLTILSNEILKERDAILTSMKEYGLDSTKKL